MPADPPVHLGEPVDAAWGELPEETRVRPASDPAGGDGEGPERLVVRLRDGGSADDGDAGAADDAASAGRATGRGAVARDRLGAVRDRYPDATVLAYTIRDDPDAAIDASRLGVEYVSGRRLAADGETLADRLSGRDGSRSPGPALDAGSEAALEPFIRIVSDRTTDLDEKLDALLRLGRDRLDLSIGSGGTATGRGCWHRSPRANWTPTGRSPSN
jgi:hypothetical protein